ncbi:hypothetical protein V2A60_000656 [Cordyceps javanica]
MESYAGTLSSLENYNPQDLSSEALDQALLSLKKQLLKAEAAKLLLPVKELPIKKDLFEVLLEQAVTASQVNVTEIATNNEVNKVVLSTVLDEDFLTRTLQPSPL